MFYYLFIRMNQSLSKYAKIFKWLNCTLITHSANIFIFYYKNTSIICKYFCLLTHLIKFECFVFIILIHLIFIIYNYIPKDFSIFYFYLWKILNNLWNRYDIFNIIFLYNIDEIFELVILNDSPDMQIWILNWDWKRDFKWTLHCPPFFFPQDIEQPDGRYMNNNEGERRAKKVEKCCPQTRNIYKRSNFAIKLNYFLLLQMIESLTGGSRHFIITT